jgi:predicted phage-related endonuclease
LQSRRWRGSQAKEFFALTLEELQPFLDDAQAWVTEVLPRMHEAERLASEDSQTSVMLVPSERERAMYEQLLRVREQYAALDYERRRLETGLKLAIGTAAGMDEIATWKTVEQRKFDLRAFREAHPDLHDSFVRDVRARRFDLL